MGERSGRRLHEAPAARVRVRARRAQARTARPRADRRAASRRRGAARVARAARARGSSRWMSAALAWTTRTLAERFERWRGEGADVAFVIGSADGLDPGFKRKADGGRRRIRDDLAARAGARYAGRAAVPRGEPQRRASVSSRMSGALHEGGAPVIYLASKSPRRRELLRQLGVAFEELYLREAAGSQSRRRRGSAGRRARRALRRADRTDQGDRRLEADGAAQARGCGRCSAPIPRSCSTARSSASRATRRTPRRCSRGCPDAVTRS